MKQKLNCSFIFPYKEEEGMLKFKKHLEDNYSDIEVIGIKGGLVDFKLNGRPTTKPRTPFFEAWKQGLKKATKKYICLTHDDTEYVGIPNLDKYFEQPVTYSNYHKDEKPLRIYNSVDFPKVGMVGIAGTTVLHRDQPWWFSTERLNGGILSGQVFYKDEKGNPVINQFGSFGEVVALDGVCMITTKEILEKVGIPECDYGEDGQLYSLDFYDQIMSLEMIKAGYKLLTIPIILVHGSKGADKRPSFFKSMDKFRDEYLTQTWRV